MKQLGFIRVPLPVIPITNTASCRARVPKPMRTASEAIDKDLVESRVSEWIRQAVIGLGLCPFASKEVESNRVRTVVSTVSTIPELKDVILSEAASLVMTEPAVTATTLVIAPQCHEIFEFFPSFYEFSLDLENIIEEDDRLAEEIMIVAFHPEHTWGQLPDDSPLHFDRRAPYPIINLLRARQVDEYANQGLTQTIVDQNGDTLLKELKNYDGTNGFPIYLAARNPFSTEVTVFDMTLGRDFYGPGAPYHVFAGCNATMGLGRMSTDVGDLLGDFNSLSLSEKENLGSWYAKFSEKYPRVGFIGDPEDENASSISTKTTEDNPGGDSGMRRRNV